MGPAHCVAIIGMEEAMEAKGKLASRLVAHVTAHGLEHITPWARTPAVPLGAELEARRHQEVRRRRVCWTETSHHPLGPQRLLSLGSLMLGMFLVKSKGTIMK